MLYREATNPSELTHDLQAAQELPLCNIIHNSYTSKLSGQSEPRLPVLENMSHNRSVGDPPDPEPAFQSMINRDDTIEGTLTEPSAPYRNGSFNYDSQENALTMPETVRGKRFKRVSHSVTGG